MEATQIIFHLHIPRTGGSALNAYLSQFFGPDKTHHFRGLDKFRDDFSDRAAVSNVRFVTGHFPYGIHKKVDWINPIYIVLLRNPVDRVISLYNFAMQSPDHKLHEICNDPSHRLADFYGNQKKLTSRFTNQQTLMVSERKKWPHFAFLHRNLLNDALEIITRPNVIVGVTEDFDGVLTVVRERLGLTEVRSPAYVNVTDRSRPHYQADRRDIAAILRHNRLDQELYEYAKVVANSASLW